MNKPIEEVQKPSICRLVVYVDEYLNEYPAVVLRQSTVQAGGDPHWEWRADLEVLRSSKPSVTDVPMHDLSVEPRRAYRTQSWHWPERV